MFSMILISHLNFTTKRERIPYILAFFESCLLEYLKSQVDVDKSTETQELKGKFTREFDSTVPKNHLESLIVSGFCLSNFLL